MMAGSTAHGSRLVTFIVGGSRYAVPLASVERVLPMVAVRPVPGAPRVVLGAINVEGRVVPVVDLRRRLGLPSRDYGLSAHLLIVQTPRRTLAVTADEAAGVTEIDPTSVAPTEVVLPGLGRVAGIAALPDGLLFIYDIEAFLTPEEEGELGQVLGQAGR
jgi:purine-binding chemotaxis protein CheW